ERLVEALATAVALGAGVLVLLDVELRIGGRAEDLARARQLVARRVLVRIPEVGADQRLRALRVRLLDRHEHAELRRLALDRARRQQLGVVDDARTAVDPE